MDRFEVWGKKILGAIENQGHLLSEVMQMSRETAHHQSPYSTSHHSQVQALEDDDPETVSRKDVRWTPITGSDKILQWAVFPREKPVQTLPESAFIAKPNHWALGN